ncbi:MAG: flavin reductase family protein [Armatimonadetes bacterium]|nr:flavin reductase family protein [Armatimonadota bacterium]
MKRFDLSELSAGEPYKLLASLVVPRPIAWVSTVADTGVVNIAPYSFFNLLGSDPPIVALGIAPAKRTGEPKDTGHNLGAIGAGFVVHLVDEASAEAMNQTAAELPAGESEAERANLEPVYDTVTVAVPRIASAPAALECRVAEIVCVGNNRVVIGEVLFVHLQDRLWDDETRRVRTEEAHFIGRMHGGGFYTRTGDLFALERPR